MEKTVREDGKLFSIYENQEVLAPQFKNLSLELEKFGVPQEEMLDLTKSIEAVTKVVIKFENKMKGIESNVKIIDQVQLWYDFQSASQRSPDYFLPNLGKPLHKKFDSIH